jgi:hypothetical protein
MYEFTHPSFEVLGARDVILGLAEKSLDAQPIRYLSGQPGSPSVL